MEVRLDRKGRLVLPSEIRKRLGTRRFSLSFQRGKIELKPLPGPKAVMGKYRGMMRKSLEEVEEAQERFLLEGRS